VTPNFISIKVEIEPRGTVIHDFGQDVRSHVLENADRYGALFSMDWEPQSVERLGEGISFGI
jgi:hypothetical protein